MATAQVLGAVVVHHRDTEQTLRCVRSLLEPGVVQPPAPKAFGDGAETRRLESMLRIELVVVDNSEDAGETSRLRAGLPTSVRLLVNERNSGFGAACVRGLQAVDGDFIMLLNPDAEALPGCLKALATSLLRDPTLGAVSPLQWWDAQRRWQLPPAWLPTGTGLWALDLAARDARQALRLSGAYRQLALRVWKASTDSGVVPQRALSGGAMMVRRAAVSALGGLFDPGYFLYYEDSDLCLRLRRAGWRMGLVPQAQVLHAWRHSQAKVQWMEAAQRHYLQTHFGGRGGWQQRLERSRRMAPLDQPLAAQCLPTCTHELEVPPAWQGGWLLEASPSPLLVPALGQRGAGPLASWPRDLCERLGGSAVSLRLAPDGPVRPGQWLVFRLAAV